MLLTLERHREIEAKDGTFLRVLVDGKDVTERCYLADDQDGWAACFCVDKDGKKYFDRARNEVAKEMLTGDVIFDGTRGRGVV